MITHTFNIVFKCSEEHAVIGIWRCPPSWAAKGPKLAREEVQKGEGGIYAIVVHERQILETITHKESEE